MTKTTKNWAAVITAIMQGLFADRITVEIDTRVYELTLSAELEGEPFVYDLLSRSGAISMIGRLDSNFASREIKTPRRTLWTGDLAQIKRAVEAESKLRRKYGATLHSRTLYYVNSAHFDALSAWAKGNRPPMTSWLEIKQKTLRMLLLSIPATEIPDLDWYNQEQG